MAVGRPIKLTPNVARKILTVTATASQTDFTPTGGYRINQLGVFRNGIRLVQGQDYTAVDGTTVTLQSGCTVGDVVEFQIFDSFNIADALSSNGNQVMGGDLTVGVSTLYSGSTGILSTNTLYAETIGDTRSTVYGDGSNLTGVANTDYVDSVNLTASGIVSFTNTTDSTSSTTGAVIISGGVGIAKSLFVGNNVTIGGTVTYEDVTNVDSVGIITAQTGIKVTAGGIDIAAGGIEVGGISTFAGSINTFANEVVITAGGLEVNGGGFDIAGVSTFDGVGNNGLELYFSTHDIPGVPLYDTNNEYLAALLLSGSVDFANADSGTATGMTGGDDGRVVLTYSASYGGEGTSTGVDVSASYLVNGGGTDFVNMIVDTEQSSSVVYAAGDVFTLNTATQGLGGTGTLSWTVGVEDLTGDSLSFGTGSLSLQLQAGAAIFNADAEGIPSLTYSEINASDDPNSSTGGLKTITALAQSASAYSF